MNLPRHRHLDRTLLSEFLDSAAAGPGARGASAAGGGALRAAKRRKVVDRRASKGRRLRYTVQAPLVGFMAPAPAPRPAFAESLFARLFGVSSSH